MSRKGNLSAALSQFDKRPAALKEQATALPASREAAAPPKKKVVKTESAHQGRAALPPSRQGKKALTGYFDPDVLRQLKVMAAAEDTTIQALMIEALNDLFKKYGKPHIA